MIPTERELEELWQAAWENSDPKPEIVHCYGHWYARRNGKWELDDDAQTSEET